MAVATIRAFTLQSGLFPVPTSGLEPQLVQSALPIGRDTETVPPLLDWAGGRSRAEDRSWVSTLGLEAPEGKGHSSPHAVGSWGPGLRLLLQFHPPVCRLTPKPSWD